MVILYWVLLAVMLVGIVGAFIPGIPGPTLILAAIVVWGLAAQDFMAIAWPLGITIVILLLGTAIDFLASHWGAKKAGASRWGLIGAIVGMICGFLGLLPALPFGGPLLGLILGPLLGAIIGELLYTRNLQQSVKAGVGIVVGTVVGNIIQGILAIVPVAAFLLTTWHTLYPVS
jgi:hypothetical protein